jgi:hypothetical protein
LTEQVYSLVSRYLDAVKRPPIDVWSANFGEEDPDRAHELLRRHRDLILAAIEDGNTNIPAMRYAVIKEFRAILGGADRATSTSFTSG